MSLDIKDSKKPWQDTSTANIHFNKVTGYKINTQKSVAFLHTNSLRNTENFTIAGVWRIY